jgi:hypothetical protein
MHCIQTGVCGSRRRRFFFRRGVSMSLIVRMHFKTGSIYFQVALCTNKHLSIMHRPFTSIARFVKPRGLSSIAMRVNGFRCNHVTKRTFFPFPVLIPISDNGHGPGVPNWYFKVGLFHVAGLFVCIIYLKLFTDTTSDDPLGATVLTLLMSMLLFIGWPLAWAIAGLYWFFSR